MQYGFAFNIAEADIVEANVAGQFDIIDAAVLMAMFPGPVACRHFRFTQPSRLIFIDIDQRYAAVIHFVRFIQQLENPLRAGHRHDDGVQLLRNLVQRTVERFIQSQEGGQAAQCQTADAVDCQHAADKRTQNIGDVAQIANDRHQDIGIFICFVGSFAQILIDLIEFLDRLLFMREHLDDLRAFHHFFDISVFFPQLPLLRAKVTT